MDPKTDPKMAEVLRKLGKITWFPKFVLLVLRRMPGQGGFKVVGPGGSGGPQRA